MMLERNDFRSVLYTPLISFGVRIEVKIRLTKDSNEINSEDAA
jgi:hypothetical protein